MIGNPQAARDAIYDALAANSTLCALIGGSANPRIYQQVGAQDAAFPLVIIRANVPERDTQNNYAETIFSKPIFDVYAIGEGLNYDDVDTIRTQIEISITPLRVIVGSNRVMSAKRIRAIDDSKTVDGISYVEAGIKYRMAIQ